MVGQIIKPRVDYLSIRVFYGAKQQDMPFLGVGVLGMVGAAVY